MEFNIVGSKGMRDLIAYFQNPKNHKDADTKHVTDEEFKSAAGKISREADQIIELIAHHYGSQYLNLIQKEGYFNDKQVSLRDMWSAWRGTDYDGDSLSKDATQLLRQLNSEMELNRIAIPRSDKQAVKCGGVYSFNDVAQLYREDSAWTDGFKFTLNGQETFDNRLFSITVQAPKGYEGKLAQQPWIEGYSTTDDCQAGIGGIVDKTGKFDVSLSAYAMSDGQAKLAFKLVSEMSDVNGKFNLNDPDICSIVINK